MGEYLGSIKEGRGRRSSYTPEMADRICVRLGGGESLRAICRTPGMPSQRAVLGWATTRPEFRRQYDLPRASAGTRWRMQSLKLPKACGGEIRPRRWTMLDARLTL